MCPDLTRTSCSSVPRPFWSGFSLSARFGRFAIIAIAIFVVGTAPIWTTPLGATPGRGRFSCSTTRLFLRTAGCYGAFRGFLGLQSSPFGLALALPPTLRRTVETIVAVAIETAATTVRRRGEGWIWKVGGAVAGAVRVAAVVATKLWLPGQVFRGWPSTTHSCLDVSATIS